METKFALPDVLNYAEGKFNDIGSYQEMSVVTPATGSAALTLGNSFIVNIPRCGSDAVLSGPSSFLRFCINNNSTTAGVATAETLTISGSCDSVFSRLEVFHNNMIVETIDNYELLSSIFLDTQVNATDRAQALNLTKGCANTAGDMTGVTITATNSRYFTTTLLSGVLGSLARTYIPLFALSGNLSFRITTNPGYKAFSWPNGTADASVTLTDIQFHANIVHLKPKIMELINQPSYQIYTESYSNFQSTILKVGTTSVEQLIPFHYISLKTIFLAMRRATQLSTKNSSNVTSKISNNISDYTFRVGSRNIPPTRVQCYATNFIEPFEELKKAYHAPGNALVSMGCHDYDSYRVQNAVNGTGSFIIGQDLESYSGKSGELISGLDTSGTDIYFSGGFPTVGGNAVVAYDSLMDFYAHYDLILNIVDGQMSSAF